MRDQWIDKIFSVTTKDFEQLALHAFHYQYQHSPVYKAYTDMLKVNPDAVRFIWDIPFLPISFFKSHEVKTTEFRPKQIFESSGTTETINSRHYVRDMGLYQESFLRAFELFYGPVADWCILGLLPSYLERKNSSLVFMVEQLIKHSRQPESGFYLYDHSKLHKTLSDLESRRQKTWLIGVSFALLDFAENCALNLESTVVVETGGMKGRRKEMIRGELHEMLKSKFRLTAIHSEYGMTELLSQAYSAGDGIFQCPPWMRILLRDEEDPLDVDSEASRLGRGAVNVIDLANIYSCCFIATDDAGVLHRDGKFQILGRIDNSDIRGCSLMAM